jgi:hypothetical protein
MSFTIANLGGGDLGLGAAVITGAEAGDFAVTANTCTGLIVAGGAPCSVQVTYTPLLTGERLAQITIPTTDPAAPTLVVPLSGDNLSPPVISATVPANGATGVAVTTPITVTFSEPIVPASLTGKITVSGGVTGTILYNPVTFTAAFTPTMPLAYGTVYTVTVAPGITDPAGNICPGGSFTFTTSSSLTPLTISANNASRAYGDANPPGTYTVTGLTGGDTISSVILTYAATATPTAAVGTTHVITPSNAVFGVGSAANYTITYVPGILTVNASLALPISLVGAPPTYYSSITGPSGAYTNAVTGDTIKALSVLLTETVNFNLPKSVTFKGGYDNVFAFQTGMTTIKGVVTISQGSLVVDRMTIQ